MREERRGRGAPLAGAAGHVVVVGNLKGGSGKSTLVINLACALAERGRRVAILDCDPQGTATSWADRGGPVRVRFEPLKNLNGAGGWLATAGEMRREVDVLLIDLPAVVAPAMGAAFLIASVILVPVAPHAVDVEGSRRVLAYLNTARAERGRAGGGSGIDGTGRGNGAAAPTRAPTPALLVPSRVRELERGLEPWSRMLEPMGLPMTPPLHDHIAFDRAFERGTWVGQAFPDGESHREVAAIAGRVLAELDKATPAGVPPSGARRPDPAADNLLPQPPSHPVAVRVPPRPTRPPPRRPWWRRTLGI